MKKSQKTICMSLLLALLLTACGGGSNSSTATAATGTSVTTSGTALATLAANTSITLDNCGGKIASNVPDFYKNYFLCSDISMSSDGNSVVFSFYGLPPYSSPYYPATNVNYTAYATDQASVTMCGAGQTPGAASGCYTKNPNTLAQKAMTVTIPINPVSKNIDFTSATTTAQINNTSGNTLDYSTAVVGISPNGLPLFSGFAAPGDNISDEAYTFDSKQGHPTGSSYYHYHRYSKGALAVMVKKGLNTSTTPGSPSSAGVEFYGMTCDGVLVLGVNELDGTSPVVSGTNALDAQSGHKHDIKDKLNVTHFTNRYHVHISPTSTYKFVPELQYYSSCISSGG
jgi:hypothetical protein